MNTVILNTENTKFVEEDAMGENTKRFLDSFQVLIIGILLPVLFLIGINTTSDKTTVKSQPTIEVKNNTYVSYTNGTIDYGKVMSDNNG